MSRYPVTLLTHNDCAFGTGTPKSAFFHHWHFSIILYRRLPNMNFLNSKSFHLHFSKSGGKCWFVDNIDQDFLFLCLVLWILWDSSTLSDQTRNIPKWIQPNRWRPGHERTPHTSSSSSDRAWLSLNHYQLSYDARAICQFRLQYAFQSQHSCWFISDGSHTVFGKLQKSWSKSKLIRRQIAI